MLDGVEQRRRWSTGEKMRIVEETLLRPGAKVTEVAQRNDVSRSLIFGWRRLARTGQLGGEPAPSFAQSRSVPRHLRSLRKSDKGIKAFVFARRRVFAPRSGGWAMRGSLGEKIGEGVFADVHAWAPGQVVKLFKSGFSRRLCGHEARMARAVFAAGAPAPEVFDEVTLEGRFGIVLSRLDGPTLLQLTKTGAVTFAQSGAILAALAISVHKTPPPPDVHFLRDWMDGVLRSSSGRLPKHMATGVPALIERLSPGDGLCHGDLHPGNVIMTVEGPRLVDWTWAMRGPAALDLAFSHIIHTEIAPQATDDPERPRAVNAAVQAEYARLAGLSQAALTAAIEPYLPIVCVIHLLWGAGGALRERPLQRVEAALRREDLI